MMKLRYVKSDDLVTVRFGTQYAVAEARELKAAGFGFRQAHKGCLGEWTLGARSPRDFQELIRLVPSQWRPNSAAD